MGLSSLSHADMHTALGEQGGKPLGPVRWRAPTAGRILGAHGDMSPVCWRPWRGQGSETAQTTCREPVPFAHHRSLLTTNLENSLCSRSSFLLHSVCLICLPPNPLQTPGFLPCAGNQRAHYLGLEREWGGGGFPFNYRKKTSTTHVSKATGIRTKSRSGHRSVGRRDCPSLWTGVFCS